MKKSLVVLMVLFSLAFVSCLSFEPVENTPVSALQEAETSSGEESWYVARAYSSLYVDIIPNTATVIIECPMVNFQLQRVTELSIVSRLQEEGIQAFAMSDYNSYYDAEIKEGKFDYGMTVIYEDIYTYEIGGGVARMSFDCTIDDMEDFKTVAKISGGISSNENYYLSFIETAEPACELVGEKIAEEYMSFTKR